MRPAQGLAARFSTFSAPARATLWITAAGFCFVATITSVRQLAHAIPVFETVFFRCIFGIAFLMPWLIRRGRSGLRTNRYRLLAARGAMAFFVTVFYYTAASMIPLANLTAITFTRPIFGTIAAILFLHEVVRARRWTAIAIGFVGVLVIVRPDVDINPGVLLVLGGVALQTVNTIIVKFLTRTEHPDTIALYHTMFILPLATIPAIWVWKTPNLEQLGWLIAIGASAIMTQRAMTRAFAAADASFVLALSYLRLPIAAFVGFVVFGEVPEVWIWVGASLICGSAFYIARREALLVRAARQTTS